MAVTVEFQNLLDKLRTYQGSLVSSKWVVPKSPRQFSHSLNRIIKLYYAVKNRQIFYPELIDKLKELSAYFRLYIIKNRPDKILYLTLLEEIEEFEPPLKFDRIEELRERSRQKCNICRVDLVYPAYIVYITEGGVEVRSEPIGIMCLHSLYGKLDKFSDSLKIAWQVEDGVDEVEEAGAKAL